MNNFKLFAGSFIEVQLPLTDEVITAFEQSEKYAYVLDDLHGAYTNEACDGVCCTLNISFNHESSETYFALETHCTYINGDTDSVTAYVDFDPVTANYFRAEAMRHILKNFNEMAKCKPVQTVVTV